MAYVNNIIDTRTLQKNIDATKRQIDRFGDYLLGKGIGQAVDSHVGLAIEWGAILIADQAKLLAPVWQGAGGGRLRSNIETSSPYYDSGSGNIVVRVGTNTEYAPYVEFGTGIYAESGLGRKTPWRYYSPRMGRFVRTVGMKPKPFLRPAFDSQRNGALDRISSYLWQKLDAYMKHFRD